MNSSQTYWTVAQRKEQEFGFVPSKLLSASLGSTAQELQKLDETATEHTWRRRQDSPASPGGAPQVLHWAMLQGATMRMCGRSRLDAKEIRGRVDSPAGFNTKPQTMRCRVQIPGGTSRWEWGRRRPGVSQREPGSSLRVPMNLGANPTSDLQRC